MEEAQLVSLSEHILLLRRMGWLTFMHETKEDLRSPLTAAVAVAWQ